MGSTYYTFKIYSYNCQYDSKNGESVSGYSAKVPNKMNPLIIYEYTSTSSVTVAIDNSVYDGGMPILYYNIYLDNNKDSQNAISSVSQSNKSEVTDLNLGTQYKLSINDENIVDEGEISDEITFTFANLPSVPQNIAITNSNNYLIIFIFPGMLLLLLMMIIILFLEMLFQLYFLEVI